LNDVRFLPANHQTPHSERWGGWFVTADLAPGRYAQRAHAGNITFSRSGVTSNQVFVDWIDSAPEMRGYPSSSSDIVALLSERHGSQERHALPHARTPLQLRDGGEIQGLVGVRLNLHFFRSARIFANNLS
jgi:hypothetical protein